MDQIIETVQISKYNTLGTDTKRVLLDKQYTLDDPTFENSGKITIPCGDETEFFELKDVNFVYLLSDCPFNLLINNLVVINTKQFSFVNPNKVITVSIAANSNYSLEIEYVYGLLKCGDQNSAVKQINTKSNVKWDKVLKKLILEQDDININDKFPNYYKDESFIQEQENQHCHCHCHCPPPPHIPPYPFPSFPVPPISEDKEPLPKPPLREIMDVPTLPEDDEQPETNENENDDVIPDIDENDISEPPTPPLPDNLPPFPYPPHNVEEVPPPPFPHHTCPCHPNDIPFPPPPPLPPLNHDRNAAVKRVKEIVDIVRNKNGKAKHFIIKR